MTPWLKNTFGRQAASVPETLAEWETRLAEATDSEASARDAFRVARADYAQAMQEVERVRSERPRQPGELTPEQQEARRLRHDVFMNHSADELRNYDQRSRR